MESFVLLLAPYAPHVCEELWQVLGHADTLAYEPWPTWDAAYLREETQEIPVQINGKVRSKVTVPAEASRDETLAAALDDAKVAELLAGKVLVKSIVIEGRMVNLVVK